MPISRNRTQFKAATHFTDVPAKEQRPLSYIRSAAVKSLFWSHCGIMLTSVIWTLAGIAGIVVGALIFAGRIPAVASEDTALFGSGACLIGIFAAVGAAGSWLRGSIFGRVYGLIFSILCLGYFPYGTVVGLLGILSFARAGQLYGDKRFPGGEIVEEYWHRKKRYGA